LITAPQEFKLGSARGQSAEEGDFMTIRTRLTQLVLACLALAVPAVAAGSLGDRVDGSVGHPIVLVNSLGAVGPTHVFGGTPGFTMTGQTVGFPHFSEDPDAEFQVGPRVVLTKPTVITEVGGFLFQSRRAAVPFNVRIVPVDASGLPADPHGEDVAGPFLASGADPLAQTGVYQRANPNILLGPGTYFALFGAQEDLVGGLIYKAELNGVTQYQADALPLGRWTNFHLVANPVFTDRAAVRVLGTIGDDIHHAEINFTSDVGGVTTTWSGDLNTGDAAVASGNGSAEWVWADARFGLPIFDLDLQLRSRHIGRTMSGSLTATRGRATIQFRDAFARYIVGDDGSLTSASTIRGSYYDGRNRVFGTVSLRLET